MVAQVEVSFAKSRDSSNKDSLSRIIDPADIPSFNDLIKEQISTSLTDESPDISTWDDAISASAKAHVKGPWQGLHRDRGG